MVDVLNCLEGPASQGGPLADLRLGESAVAALFFTTTGAKTVLHWEPDQSVSSYVICAGEGCPLCAIGDRAKEYVLLPVIEIQSSSVKVLRIPPGRGPGTLASQIAPFLRKTNSTDTAALISRSGTTYTVVEKALSAHADRGVDAVKAYEAAVKEGLKLADTFKSFSIEELAEIPRVRRLLEAFDTKGESTK